MQAYLSRLGMALVAILSLTQITWAQGVLTFEDVMKFDDIGAIALSDNGEWFTYSVWPDRGDGEVRVQRVNGNSTYTLELGNNPRITTNGEWVGAFRRVALATQLKQKRKAPKQGLFLLNTANGAITEFDNVRSFSFSNDGQWVAIHHYQSKEVEDLKSKNRKLGTEVTLRNLASGTDLSIPFVSSMRFDSLSTHLVYAVVDTSGNENGIFAYDLSAGESNSINEETNGFYSNLTWDEQRGRIAFTKTTLDDSYSEGNASIHMWETKNGKLQTLVNNDEGNDGWVLRSNNRLQFTNDGERLFFGFTPQAIVDLDAEKDEEEDEIDIYDVDDIIADRGMDLWHGDDPRIKTHEKVTWNQRKRRTYTAVYHIKKKNWVQLADLEMPFVQISHNKDVVLGNTNEPYLKEVTWDGTYQDWYTLGLGKGEKAKITSHHSGPVYLSPEGKYAVYYNDKNWHLYDIKKKTTRNLTAEMEVPFANEDHDYPSNVPGYGIAGWTEGDKDVLIYDKYDIWQFSTKDNAALNITGGLGREAKRIFRARNLKPGAPIYENGDDLFLTSYHDLNKNFGFYSAKIGEKGVTQLLEEEKKFTFVTKADGSDRILYKREAYDEFPNIWTADNWKFENTRQLTNLHMDLHEKWNWGKAELIDWLSLDGTYIQGVVIKPDNYDPNKRYPIMTYYYRFFTNRLHDFNEPKTNHRPVFAQYVSDDYVVFLPDIRFEIGRPGFAATKSLVPGIQKLVELGIADEDKLGLHGHSWSGYQTAFIITQTDIFDAAVSGAPVSNMTSAYGGIRWASGLARQFQYEKTQSRIGGSVIEYLERYIENSPLFFVDKINTPMLIQHGDADGAVPWYQSIELYLAMRRYNKDVVFLQYHDEPHHLQKFPNKLDYAIRMKQYFDYYLKGIGEPEWILKGEAYVGN